MTRSSAVRGPQAARGDSGKKDNLMHVLLRTTLAGLCFSSLACAQGSVARFMPKDPTITIEVDGPVRFLEKFAETNFGAMLGSQEFDALRSQVIELALAERESLGGERADRGREFINAGRAAMDGYSGRFVAWSSFRPSPEGGPATGTFVAVFTPSENGDLGEIARVFNDAIRRDGALTRIATSAGGREFEVTDIDQGRQLVLPTMVDGNLVVASGNIESWLAALDGEGDASAVGGDDAEPASDAGMVVRVDRSIWGPIVASVQATRDPQMRPYLDVLGPLLDRLDALGDLTIEVEPAAPYVRTTVRLETQAGRPSFLDLVRPNGPGPRTLLPLIVDGTVNLETATLNLDAVVAIAAEIAAARDSSLDELETELSERLGVQLRAEVLDHIEGSVLWGDLVDPEFGDETSYVVVGLKDGVALARTVDEQLRAHGLHAARRTKEYRDHKVSQMNLGFFDLHWAFTPSALVLGFGAEPGDAVRMVLDADTARTAGERPAAWAEPIAKRLAALPDDWTLISFSDGREDDPRDVAAMFFDAVAPGASEFGGPGRELLVEALQLLPRFELDACVSAIYIDKSSLTLRAIW